MAAIILKSWNSSLSFANLSKKLLPLSVYRDKRIVIIFILGISQGFPWFIAGTALTLWLQESGLSRSSIGLAGAIFLAYTINFLWSPLVDRFNFGPLGKKFGGRRTWILAMQATVAICCFYVSIYSPQDSLRALIITIIVIAVASATQDIAIDGLRIDLIEKQETQQLSAAASAITAGWWTGYAGLGFLPLWLSDQPNWNWPQIYPILGLMMACLMVAPLLCREPKTDRSDKQQAIKQQYIVQLAQQPAGTSVQLFTLLLLVPAIVIWVLLGSPMMPETISSSLFYVPVIAIIVLTIFGLIFKLLWNSTNTIGSAQTSSINSGHHILAWLLVTIVEPLKLFFSKNGFRLAIAILLFIFLFKIGEAFLGRMSVVFYKEVGFSNTDIAVYSKLTTWWITILFALIGGLVNMHYGVVKGLFLSGIAMASTNLLFSVIAQVGPVEWLFFITVVVDSLAQAWSSVAFVAVMSLLCDRTFSASQYALMVSLGAMGRTFISSSSGFVVDFLNGNWTLFFILTALLVIPSLLILVKIGSQITKIEREAVSDTASQ